MISIICLNISVIIIMATIIWALYLRGMTKGNSNSLFLGVCKTILMTAAVDCTEVLLAMFAEPTERVLIVRYILRCIYYLAHNIIAAAGVLFIISVIGIWNRLKKSRTYKTLYAAPLVISMLILAVNLFYPIAFRIEAGELAEGPMIVVFTLIPILYLWVGAVILARHKNIVEHRVFVLLESIIPVAVICVAIQYFLAISRIELLVYSAIFILLAIGVHRPDETTDYIVNLQNTTSFLDAMKKVDEFKIDQSILLVKITNHIYMQNVIGVHNYQEVLKKVSQLLKDETKVISRSSELYYLNQGTFAIVVDSERKEVLRWIGRDVCDILSRPMRLGRLTVDIKLKSCILNYPEDMPGVSSIYNFAKTFHNRIEQESKLIILSEDDNAGAYRLLNDMEDIINNGINDNNYEIYYQPIYSIKAGRYNSAEALIRLKDDKYGYVSPALFIPMAEESGAIHQIGSFLVESVCQFIAGEEFRESHLEYIEINISVAQFMETGLAENILSTMEKYGVRPDQINLEITESAADHDPVVTSDNIRKLHEAGVQLSLDDYGSGYSNIGRIVSLPVGMVKMDKGFADEIHDESMWSVIVHTVDMLKELDKKILVEGVEDKETYDLLESLGCDYIQGYYFSKPISKEELVKLLSN